MENAHFVTQPLEEDSEQIIEITATTKERLDLFVQKNTGLSRNRIKKLIEKGLITVNGEPAKKAGIKLKGGESIVINIPPPEPTELRPYDTELDIVFEDKHMVIINKPAGMVVHPAAGHKDKTLVNALISRFPQVLNIGDRQRPGIVHRLDKDTSGLIIVAKDHKTHTMLTNMMKEKSITKIYIAVCWKAPLKEEGKIDLPIGRHPVNRKKMAVIKDKERARHAVTLYKTISKTQNHSLIAARLITGRTHQIRVHFHHMGFPIIGDPIYGKKGLDLINRQALHAIFLSFKHPITGKVLKLFASIPEDIIKVCNELKLELNNIKESIKYLAETGGV